MARRTTPRSTASRAVWMKSSSVNVPSRSRSGSDCTCCAVQPSRRRRVLLKTSAGPPARSGAQVRPPTSTELQSSGNTCVQARHAPARQRGDPARLLPRRRELVAGDDDVRRVARRGRERHLVQVLGPEDLEVLGLQLDLGRLRGRHGERPVAPDVHARATPATHRPAPPPPAREAPRAPRAGEASSPAATSAERATSSRRVSPPSIHFNGTLGAGPVLGSGGPGVGSRSEREPRRRRSARSSSVNLVDEDRRRRGGYRAPSAYWVPLSAGRRRCGR